MRIVGLGETREIDGQARVGDVFVKGSMSFYVFVDKLATHGSIAILTHEGSTQIGGPTIANVNDDLFAGAKHLAFSNSNILELWQEDIKKCLCLGVTRHDNNWYMSSMLIPVGDVGGKDFALAVGPHLAPLVNEVLRKLKKTERRFKYDEEMVDEIVKFYS
jgi:hypothetical protein